MKMATCDWTNPLALHLKQANQTSSLFPVKRYWLVCIYFEHMQNEDQRRRFQDGSMRISTWNLICGLRLTSLAFTCTGGETCSQFAAELSGRTCLWPQYVILNPPMHFHYHHQDAGPKYCFYSFNVELTFKDVSWDSRLTHHHLFGSTNLEAKRKAPGFSESSCPSASDYPHVQGFSPRQWQELKCRPELWGEKSNLRQRTHKLKYV